MSRFQLKYWPVLFLYDWGEEFIAKIKMVLVYGQCAEKALMVLKDDSVYEVSTTSTVVVLFDSAKDVNSLWKPTKVDELSNKGVKDFVWGSEYGVAALTDTGEVYYWKQKLSEAEVSWEARPILIGDKDFGGKSIVQISCCYSCLFALTKDGEVFKHSSAGIVNCFEKPCLNTPLRGPVKYIACNHSHVSIVDTYGHLHVYDKAFRYSSTCGGVPPFTVQKFQLQHLHHHKFMTLPPQTVIVKVACGCCHSLALSEDGDVYVWGQNSYGQLGTGTIESSTTAVKVTSTIMGKVADIAAIPSDFISAALTCTGQVFVWGRCRGLKVFNPILTDFSTFYEVFGTYAHSNVMHSPLILGYEEKKEENEEGATDVIDSLRQAFDNPSNSDFTVKVEGKPIHVHKSVLQIRSVYFQSMFKEQWTENNQSAIEHNDFPYDVYKSFLKYLYTGEIDVQGEKLMELLALGNAYCELQLKQRCAQILGQDIGVSNVPRLYDIAVTHGSTELEDLCVEFASNHMSITLQSPQFAALNAEKAQAFMIKAAARELSLRTKR